MLYLNEEFIEQVKEYFEFNINKCCIWIIPVLYLFHHLPNLTLTSVVFELNIAHVVIFRYEHLTLTSVVFELSTSILNIVHLINLTLTSVVFEYVSKAKIRDYHYYLTLTSVVFE